MAKSSKSSGRTLRILVANGVNLDLLGQRESHVYGDFTLRDLEQHLKHFAATLEPLFPGYKVELNCRQSNDETEFLGWMSESWDGALINAGAWTHTSLAIADRLRATQLKFIEVHISNIAAREAFRHHSYLSPVAAGVVFGMGADSYTAALLGLLKILTRS